MFSATIFALDKNKCTIIAAYTCLLQVEQVYMYLATYYIHGVYNMKSVYIAHVQESHSKYRLVVQCPTCIYYNYVNFVFLMDVLCLLPSACTPVNN